MRIVAGIGNHDAHKYSAPGFLFRTNSDAELNGEEYFWRADMLQLITIIFNCYSLYCKKTTTLIPYYIGYIHQPPGR